MYISVFFYAFIWRLSAGDGEIAYSEATTLDLPSAQVLFLEGRTGARTGGERLLYLMALRLSLRRLQIGHAVHRRRPLIRVFPLKSRTFCWKPLFCLFFPFLQCCSSQADGTVSGRRLSVRRSSSSLLDHLPKRTIICSAYINASHGGFFLFLS